MLLRSTRQRAVPLFWRGPSRSGKKIRLACSAELRDWGTVHLHQFFSHWFFYARKGRRIRGTACSLEHCFHLMPCEVFRLSSFFVDETLVFDHLLHSCRVTFYNAFWRFFFSVLSIILRNNSPYNLMKKKNIKDTMEALLSYSGQLMWYLIFDFRSFLLSCDISEELREIVVIERKITTPSPLPLLISTTAPPPPPSRSEHSSVIVIVSITRNVCLKFESLAEKHFQRMDRLLQVCLFQLILSIPFGGLLWHLRCVIE